MFQNSWSIKLAEPPAHLALACLPDPAIVYQGASNKLCVFTNNQTQTLPIRKEVIGLGSLNRDKVLILTRYSLNCFDVLSNEDVFTLQFQNAEKLFVFGDRIYVISGATLCCYNDVGQQLYVNNISSAITTIASIPTEHSDLENLIIATVDITMFKYSKLNIVFDFGKVIGNVTALCWVSKGVMVGTEEGTVAYYETKKYKWKAKSIHSVFKIIKFNEASEFCKNTEFQNKKEDRIIVVRTDGNLELRDWQNGGTLAKIKAGQDIIDIFVTDFRKEGGHQILCGLESGTIKAFNLKDQQNQEPVKNATVEEVAGKGQQIEQLNKIKQQLLFQINQLKNSLQAPSNSQNQIEDHQKVMGPDFKLTANLIYEDGLILQANAINGYISGITFEQSIMPIFVEKTNKLKYKFLNSAQMAGEIMCEILVHSSPSSTTYEVRKIPITLPKFWKWSLNSNINKEISGRLKFKFVQRTSRLLLWSKQCFFMSLSPKQEERLESLAEIRLRFFNFYSNQEMEIVFQQSSGTICILSNCLKSMGQIFQDLINYTGIKNLNSELEFAEQKQKVKELLETVEKLSQNKVSMSTDLADTINTIKFLLVKGQSARVVGSMNSFRRTYGEIMQLNRNLVTEIEKKNINMRILTETLKNVNNFINQIANVRYGDAKNQVIARCREAIKNRKFPQIYRIMDKGADSEV